MMPLYRHKPYNGAHLSYTAFAVPAITGLTNGPLSDYVVQAASRRDTTEPALVAADFGQPWKQYVQALAGGRHQGNVAKHLSLHHLSSKLGKNGSGSLPANVEPAYIVVTREICGERVGFEFQNFVRLSLVPAFRIASTVLFYDPRRNQTLILPQEGRPIPLEAPQSAFHSSFFPVVELQSNSHTNPEYIAVAGSDYRSIMGRAAPCGGRPVLHAAP